MFQLVDQLLVIVQFELVNLVNQTLDVAHTCGQRRLQGVRTIMTLTTALY